MKEIADFLCEYIPEREVGIISGWIEILTLVFLVVHSTITATYMRVQKQISDSKNKMIPVYIALKDMPLDRSQKTYLGFDIRRNDCEYELVTRYFKAMNLKKKNKNWPSYLDSIAFFKQLSDVKAGKLHEIVVYTDPAKKAAIQVIAIELEKARLANGH